MADQYGAVFFGAIADGSRRSADAIVPVVVDAIAPRSVIDVGCGTGTWLAAFRAAGVDDVLGLDGGYVDRSQLQIPETAVETADLTQRLNVDRQFDLAVSLEVAEHLPPQRAESFIADLVELAPAVLFSAAIPDQGGVHHIGERWQDEWATLFADHGLRPVDIIRPRVWGNENVEWWYAQNTFLYVANESSLRASDVPLRVVHPRLFRERMAYFRSPEPKTLRELLPEMRVAALASLRWRIGRRQTTEKAHQRAVTDSRARD